MVCKIFDTELGSKSWACKKICKIYESDLGSMSGVMRGFQNGIILGGRTFRRDYIEGLQKGVAKKFAKYLHLSWDLSRGS